MKRTNLIFWIVTILFSAYMLFSAITEIQQTPEAITFMRNLGYPDYFNPFIGIMKVLGIIAILIPGFPRLKEWAYAGLFFDLAGATYSQIAAFGWMPEIAFMLPPIIFLFISYFLHHKRMNPSASMKTAKAEM